MFALPSLPIQSIYYSRVNKLFPHAVLFEVPLLCAPAAIHGERRGYYILVDITAEDVLQWEVFIPKSTEFMHPLAGQTVTLGQLQLRSHDMFLKQLLVRQATTWLPWMLCNPFNLCGFTVRGPNRSIFNTKESRATILTGLNRQYTQFLKTPLAIPLARSLYPMEIKFLVRGDLETIRERRTTAQPLKMDLPMEEDEDLVAPPLLTTGVIAHLPDNIEDINVTEADMVLNPADWNYDKLMKFRTATAMRLFLLNIFRHFARKDFRLPKLLRICAQGTSSHNTTGLCCVFEKFQEWIWVNKDNFTHTVHSACTELRVPDDVVSIAKDYGHQYEKFTLCQNRPASPFAWTQTEENNAADALPKKPDDKDDDTRRAYIREYAAQDVATRPDALQLSVADAEAATDLRFEQLWREDLLHRRKEQRERLVAAVTKAQKPFQDF